MDHLVISELRAHARVLHRRAAAHEPDALQRLRILPELARAADEPLAELVKRRHCLAAIARQLGFRNWVHAKAVLTGSENEDFGTLLYPGNCYGHWNIWSADHAEARTIREAHGGYLLAYRRQFLIVDRDFIESMGLDPNDPDWEVMGRDWARPRDANARSRLYRQLVQNALVMSVLQRT